MLPNGDFIIKKPEVEDKIVHSSVSIRNNPNKTKELELYLNRSFIKNYFKIKYKKWKCKKDGIKFNNDEKFCIPNIDEVVITESVEVCKGTYYNSYLTNLSDGHNELIIRDSKKLMSNEVGVSTMLLTRDNYLIIRRQPWNNLSSSGLLAPSGSGSIDWKDYSSDECLDRVVCRCIERELREELCLSDSSSEVRLSTMVIGYFEWVKKYYKPELVCLTCVDKDLAGLNIKNPNISIMRVDEIEQFLNLSCSNFNSTPLYVNLMRVDDLINHNDRRIKV